jgi:hypothetical protein
MKPSVETKEMPLCDYPQKILDHFFNKGFSINKSDYDFLMRTVVEIQSTVMQEYFTQLSRESEDIDD